MSKEKVKNFHTSGINFSPTSIDKCSRFSRVKSREICSKEDSLSLYYGKTVNL